MHLKCSEKIHAFSLSITAGVASAVLPGKSTSSQGAFTLDAFFCDAAQIRCAFFDALRAHRIFSGDASLSVKVRKFQLESLRNTTRLLTTSQRGLETSAVTPSSRKPARQHQFCNAEFFKARHRDNTEVFRVSRTLEGEILMRFQYIVYSLIEICRLVRLLESQYFINRLDLFIVVVKQHGASKQSA